jgi:DNA-directed RNA polymerase specialized sigma24 family protein
VTAKQIRAAFRHFHAFREAAARENCYSIEVDGDSLNLLDMERIIGDNSPLPPRTRQAFILNLVEDMPPEAVASDMGISKGSVAQHVTQALKIIEEEWRR